MVGTAGAGLIIALPAGLAVAGGFFALPVAISTTDAVKTNKEIDILFNEIALKNQSLPPHSTIQGLVFVQKKNFNPNFEIALTESMCRPLILASNPAQTTVVA